VIFVVFLFLGNVRAALVPSVAVPLSLLGTFGGMYLLGYSLDNFSLMALIISTGFVIDDAIVVLENVTRHRENGETALAAALNGSAEVSFNRAVDEHFADRGVLSHSADGRRGRAPVPRILP